MGRAVLPRAPGAPAGYPTEREDRVKIALDLDLADSALSSGKSRKNASVTRAARLPPHAGASWTAIGFTRSKHSDRTRMAQFSASSSGRVKLLIPA